MTIEYLEKIIDKVNRIETKAISVDNEIEDIETLEFLKILEKYKIKLMVAKETFDNYSDKMLNLLEDELKKLEIQLDGHLNK